MYLEHFGIAQYPFSLTPNTRFFLKLPSHQEAFESVVQVLSRNGYASSITGEVGTGKTMLCRKVLNALDLYPDRFVTLFVPHPVLGAEDIMHTIADEIHAPITDSLRYDDLTRVVTERLKALAESGRRIVLFIDEAQAMPEESLKAVYLLTQVELPDNRHLQLVLFGQPELAALLQRPGLWMLQEALDSHFELSALDLDGTRAYVQHRLNKAGYSGPEIFLNKAFDRLYAGSRGVPRLINILCHKAMMAAYGKGDRQIGPAHVDAAIADTEPSFGGRPRR